MEVGWWPVRLWPSQNPEAVRCPSLRDTKSSPQPAPPSVQRKSNSFQEILVCAEESGSREGWRGDKSPTNALKDTAEKEVVGSGPGVAREASWGTGP